MTVLPSPTALKAMQHLLRYRLLSAQQLVALGISSSIPYIQRVLQPLHEGKSALVGYQDYSNNPGRLPRLYWLTTRGNKVMAEAQFVDYGQLPYLNVTPPMPPDHNPMAKAPDYHHRVLFIECHIALEKALVTQGLELTFFHTYFDQLNPPKATHDKAQRMRSLPLLPFAGREVKPDGVFLFFDHVGGAVFCALELHRLKDTGRIYRELVNHAEALTDGVMERVYGLDFPYRILTVLDDDGMRDRVRKRVANDVRFAQVGKHFWFASFDDMASDFRTAWQNPDGTPVALFKHER